MSGNSIFALALRFRDQLPQVLVEEFDALLGAIQIQGNKIGQPVFSDVSEIQLFGNLGASRWVKTGNTLDSTLSYAKFGNSVTITVFVSDSTVSGNPTQLWVAVPRALLPLPANRAVVVPVVAYIAGVFTPSAFAMIDTRGVGNPLDKIVINKSDLTAWAAGKTQVFFQLTFPLI